MNNIEFKFKNNRDYLHGTDIFNYLVKKKKYTLIDIKFKKPLNSIPTIISEVKNKAIAVECTLNKFKKKKLFLINSKKKIKNHYLADESIPKKNIKFTKNSISCDYVTKRTPIEILVNLTKKLHQKNVSKNKKWIFTRILLHKNFNYSLKKKFKIIIIQNYKNISTISKIFEYNIEIGLINFMCKKKND